MLNNNFVHLEHTMSKLAAYAKEHVQEGGIPFAAFVVDAKGTILGRGVNRVLELHDPTAHAEVNAIRDACRTLGSHHLRGAILLASGEPCAMCYLNALFAGISAVYYIVDRNEAARAGFDYRSSYQLLEGFPEQWPMHVGKHTISQALEPFNLYERLNS